ncbi:hypothetical protein CAPTEDRAFT_215877 [Capitella teleta]|uniref:RCC1-like domain-containing protein n=1 Tax=Capitella teleta TaxID=283909 RepID=R7U5D1_CAPTE|nr:hypothetical protein CAPTEDRAFT_215877 [Capitella teleta]|eukprot:ELU01326.1 hypothetical protein CAPTEDRAFT_215877 [Capitella teleta]
MSSSPCVKMKWAEHLNTAWVAENLESAMGREGASELYERLVLMQEVIATPQEVLHLKGPPLPDFDSEKLTSTEQAHFLEQLLASQNNLGRAVCADSPFCSLLQKRLTIFRRIFYAISTKYHQSGNNNESAMSKNAAATCDAQKTSSPRGSDALVEMGVRTGLSLLFSLLRQNWAMASQMTTEFNLCNDVLQTALGVLHSLPPLSLSNESKLPALGLTSLKEVTSFLKSVSQPQSPADALGKRLACELFLLLCVQRGSLSYLLEWMEMALCASSGQPTACISVATFNDILSQMNKDSDCLAKHGLDDSEGFTPLYQAAVCLMEEIFSSASHYTRTFIAHDVTHADKQTCVAPPSDADSCVVYAWGSNSSHQLAEGTSEKILQPKLVTNFPKVQQLEAGQYCTFVIDNDGAVSACGKGSYGRLGLGDSSNQTAPKKLSFDATHLVKKISSSKGSDGHTLALTVEGALFSWGDGDYGKLGHGNISTQKYPKLIQGPLAGKVVKCICAGYRHSAAVTEDGQLYTWGEGDFGRLGHGDNSGRNVPTLVKDISNVGQVACGSSHTIAVSQDGRTVWTFGGGKLGFEDANRVYRPKVVDAFAGLYIRKVACGSHSSLALTSSGQVAPLVALCKR